MRPAKAARGPLEGGADDEGSGDALTPDPVDASRLPPTPTQTQLFPAVPEAIHPSC